MEILSLRLNLALRPIKGCIFLWLPLIVLMSSCGFQHRRYTTGWHWDGASPVASRVAPIEKTILTQCEEKATPEDQTPILAIRDASLPVDSMFNIEKQSHVDTLFPITHQPLVYWEGEQWNVLDETIIDHQLEEARGEAWVWVIEILLVGISILLYSVLSLDFGWGLDSLARSIELNQGVRRKLKNAQPHPLLNHWKSYLQWTSLIMSIPLILLGLLLLLPTILYIYGQ